MKKTMLLATVFAIFLALPVALATDGAFVNKSGATWTFIPDVYYYEDQASYIDTTVNPDLGVAACGIADSSKYGGVAYAANVSGTWTYVLVSYDSANFNPYSAMDQDVSSICTSGYASLPSEFGVASSTHTDYDPPVYIAAFPGNMYLLVDSTNSSAPDAVYPFNNSRGRLLGSFTDVSASYSQTTHDVTVDFSDIIFYKSASTTIQKANDDVTHGISSDRRMIIAACTDQYGTNCSDVSVITSATAQLPVDLATDITSPSDSAAYTRYAVLNGIGTSYCIGPDLRAYNVTITPTDPLYTQADAVNISVVIDNNGNVNVGTAFNVSIWQDGLDNIFIQNSTIASLSSYTSTMITLTGVNLSNKTSGNHTINVRVEDAAAGIADCNDGNDQMERNFTIIKTYNIITYINGTAGTDFPQVGRPYNLSVHATDSDGGDVDSGIIKVIEKNGINSFAPIQYWDDGGENASVVSVSTAQVKLNGTGWREFAVIPTGNKLIADEPNIADYYTGNYSLYLELYTSDGTYRTSKNMTVGSLTPADPTEQIGVKNQDVVESVYDLVYRAYSTVRRWLQY